MIERRKETTPFLGKTGYHHKPVRTVCVCGYEFVISNSNGMPFSFLHSLFRFMFVLVCSQIGSEFWTWVSCGCWV